MSKSVTVRLGDDVLAWADEYAGERGVSRTTLIENALASFKEDCANGTPELKVEPEVKLKPGECTEVQLKDRISSIHGPFPVYGESVEPPGDLKFVCARGDCGWTSQKIEKCPTHGRYSVPRGSASRRIIKAPPDPGERSREDFVRLTAERARVFAEIRGVSAAAVVGGSSEARDASNKTRQAVLNKAKGMEV